MPNQANQQPPEGQESKETQLFAKMAENLYAEAISDILDEMGFRDQVVDPGLGLVPFDPEMVTVGRAWTLVNDRDDKMEDPYALAIEAMDAMKPGQLLVATGRQPLEVGIFGELSATRVRKLGGTGALVNGFTRDGRKIMAMKFPIFCRGNSPIDTTGRVRVVDYGVPVEIGGRTIQPGQIVFADMNGIVLVPTEVEDEVIAKALERAEVESAIRKELSEGATMDEVWNKYHVL